MLSLGSHWKAIHVDRDGRIVSSVTSLGGELLDVVTSQTVLAGSLPRQWPAAFDDAWVDEGVHEAQRSGFARALFCVRLLEQRVTSTPDERLAYLIGVAIGSVMDTLLARRSFRAGTRVLVTGPPALAHAFAAQLQGTSVDAVPVSATQVAHAVRTGMRQVLAPQRLRAVATALPRPVHPRAGRRRAPARRHRRGASAAPVHHEPHPQPFPRSRSRRRRPGDRPATWPTHAQAPTPPAPAPRAGRRAVRRGDPRRRGEADRAAEADLALLRRRRAELRLHEGRPEAARASIGKLGAEAQSTSARTTCSSPATARRR